MELVDAPDSKSGARDGVRVRVPPPAPKMFLTDKSFVSYSQLGEDKLVRNILDRLLDAGHVLPSLTYVDIGAYHPRKASNTFFLYREKWSGTVVDANKQKCALFSKKRPRDLVLTAAVVPGDLKGKSLRLEGNGLNDAAERVVLCDSGCSLPTITLDEVIQKHIDRFRNLPSLINVDVEGLDAEVVLDSRTLARSSIPLLLVEHFLIDGLCQGDVLSYQQSKLVVHLKIAGYQLISVVGPTLFFSHSDYWVPFSR